MEAEDHVAAGQLVHALEDAWSRNDVDAVVALFLMVPRRL